MTTIAKSVREIAMLNNEGAAYFSAGKFGAAFRTLEKATILSIRTSKKNSRDSSLSSEASVEGSISESSRRVLKKSSCPKRLSKKSMGRKCVDTPSPDNEMSNHLTFTDLPVPLVFHDSFYVCSKVIVIPSPDDIANELTSAQALAYCKTVITFNMAMIHHWIGKITTNAKILQMATRLYDRSIKSLNSHELVMMNSSCASGQALMLAASNNKAHIMFNDFHDFITARELLGQAVGILGNIKAANPPGCIVMFDTNEIVLNALVWRISSYAPAA